MSKNPHYYSPDVTAGSLASLRTRIIPRDELKLLEEIGEGAFGKVYKGEWELGRGQWGGQLGEGQWDGGGGWGKVGEETGRLRQGEQR